MIGQRLSFWHRVVMATSCALGFAVSGGSLAWATELPPGILNYLRQKDTQVKVRFDGLVLFSNGESYVPVIPQDPDLDPDSQRVIATMPQNVPYPEIIQFDNNFFLMKLILTSSGRLTFPKMAEYPMQLREGLLPQDFVMPNNLFIPVELKIILGALPYNPSYVPAKNPLIVPPSVTLAKQGGQAAQLTVTNRLTYVFDLNDQKVLAIEPLTGKVTGEVPLGSVPAGMKLSPDGSLLFIPCLSTNELVVVDTGSNLVKTRVPVGERPDSVLYVPDREEVVVSNRYSPLLSVVDVKTLQSGANIALPGNGGAMAMIPGESILLVADSGQSKLYLVNLITRTVEKTIPALPDISAIKALKNSDGALEIWVASRSNAQVSVMDLQGTVLKTLPVGQKPVDMIVYDNQLFVLSAGDARFDVINLGSRTTKPFIPLVGESFPSSVVAVPSEQRAYVATAGSTDFIIFNLALGQVEQTVPVKFRAGMIAMTPDVTVPEPVIQLTRSSGADNELPAVQPTSTAKDAALSPDHFVGGASSSGRLIRKFSILKLGRGTEGEKKSAPRGPDGKPLAMPLGMPIEGASEAGGALPLPVKPGARLNQQEVDPAAADLPEPASL
ncbi:YncE family protein [Vampirovibrio sp.]|uniref:YncE family protein n=1 Tax=Vampirovibrio sp. TaxID=2717857 RepID=UPI0035934073